MKLLHIHLASENLEKSRQFYSTLFDAAPSKVESDYLEWTLPEYQAVLSISKDVHSGLRSLGLVFDDAQALSKEHDRLGNHFSLEEVKRSGCCHAETNTFWLKDQQQVPWMLFQKAGDFSGLGDVAPVQNSIASQLKSTCCN